MTVRPAAALTSQIVTHIASAGGYAWRQNTSGIFDRSRGIYRTAAKKGVSDVLGCYKGRLLAIEVKIGTDRLSDDQVGFLANVRHAGGMAYVAKDFPSFQAWWEEVCCAAPPVVD